jgi:hypothetical protein
MIDIRRFMIGADYDPPSLMTPAASSKGLDKAPYGCYL